MARKAHFSGDIYDGPHVPSICHIEIVKVEDRKLEVSPLGLRCPTCNRVYQEPVRCKCSRHDFGRTHKQRVTSVRLVNLSATH
jgi:hypothetical protein